MARTNPDNYEEYEVIKKFNKLVDECVKMNAGYTTQTKPEDV